MNKIYTLLVILTIMGCQNELKEGSQGKNTLNYDIDFPSNIYTHRKYKGKITFYNAMLDTIAKPRRDTTNFRFITYKPFQPYIEGDQKGPIFKDSVILDNNTVNIEFEFDKPGIYNIGGYARDGIMMGYYTNGIRDSVRIIKHDIILSHKIVVKDSI